MNTVGVEASSKGAYMYMCLYMHIMFYLFIYYLFATCIALGQAKQSIRHERNKHSQTFYKNYINSVNKLIRIIVQLHKCD